MIFPRIWQTVERVMDKHATVAQPSLDAILAADQWAREQATADVESLHR
jgi:1-deoxy-D-xylulose 5-phosphate reductoisomerase